MAEVDDPLAAKPPDLGRTVPEYSECQECRQKRNDSVVDQESENPHQQRQQESMITSFSPSGLDPSPTVVPSSSRQDDPVTMLVDDRGRTHDARLIAWRVACAGTENMGVNAPFMQQLSFLPNPPTNPYPTSTRDLQRNAPTSSSRICKTCKSRPIEESPNPSSTNKNSSTYVSKTSISALDTELPFKSQSNSTFSPFMATLPFRPPAVPSLPFETPGLPFTRVPPTRQFDLADPLFHSGIHGKEKTTDNTMNEQEDDGLPESSNRMSHTTCGSNKETRAIPDLLLPDTPSALQAAYEHPDLLLSTISSDYPTSSNDQSHHVPYYRRARDAYTVRTGYVEKKIRVRKRRRRHHHHHHQQQQQQNNSPSIVLPSIITSASAQ